MIILNLTPHTINILTKEGEHMHTISPEEVPARLKATTEVVGDLDGIPLSQTVFGETENLPEASENNYFIVSRLVMAGNPDRTDLLVPNDLVRDDEGFIIGAKSLANN
jgi:hypothetical protein